MTSSGHEFSIHPRKNVCLGSFHGSPRSSYARPPPINPSPYGTGNGYHYPPSPHSLASGSHDPYSETTPGDRSAPPPYRPPPADQPPISRSSSYPEGGYDSSSSSLPVHPVLPSATVSRSHQGLRNGRPDHGRQLPDVPGRGRPEGEEGFGSAPPLPTRRSVPSIEDPHLGERCHNASVFLSEYLVPDKPFYYTSTGSCYCRSVIIFSTLFRTAAETAGAQSTVARSALFCSQQR